MCYLLKCSKCNKITWSGCGSHVSTLKNKVDDNQKCTCVKWD